MCRAHNLTKQRRILVKLKLKTTAALLFVQQTEVKIKKEAKWNGTTTAV
jgi:hypothetical protein